MEALPKFYSDEVVLIHHKDEGSDNPEYWYYQEQFGEWRVSQDFSSKEIAQRFHGLGSLNFVAVLQESDLKS